MSKLSFVIHCIDGGVVAADAWEWQDTGPPDVVPFGKSGCIIVHGPAFETGLRLWKEWALTPPSAETPLETTISQVVERLAPLVQAQRSAAKKEVPPFGYLVAGFFGGRPDLVKVNINSAAPTEVSAFGHNVFNGLNDVARALDQKLPPRSLTTDKALYVAAFWILQSHTVYFEDIGSRFSLGILDREEGLRWQEPARLKRIQEVAASASLMWSKDSLSLFQVGHA